MKAPYGSWQSPVTTDLIVAGTVALSGPCFDGDEQYWAESRPQEGGRTVVVRRNAKGEHETLFSAPFNARSRVHEYGGDPWLVHQGVVYFVNFSDQQIYVTDTTPPRRLTDAGQLRFANGTLDSARNRIIYIIEDHAGGGEAANKIGAVDLLTGAVTILAEGNDFYSSPTLSPDGKTMAWLSWDHPDMPWDQTRLWLAQLDAAGMPLTPIKVAGEVDESVQQPRFSPTGELYFISDLTGWWNIYVYDAVLSRGRPVCLKAAEFGVPAWGFGTSTFSFLSATEILCVYGERAEAKLARLDVGSGQLSEIETGLTVINGLHLHNNTATFVGASPTAFAAIINLDLARGDQQILRTGCSVDLPDGYYSVPQAIEFETADKDRAHGFYYPPTNKDFEAPLDTLPPLLVILHGGPTGSTQAALSLSTQFWTSRGFAVLDLNYRGSTGYGRFYRQKLNGRWGIADVDDTVYGARYLVQQGLADPNRLAIRGGSAGGYTTLAAIAFRDTFKAAASHYGIGDLETLARDTHKFESRYLDSLIGPYPADVDVYRERSPIHHIDQLSCPVIFFQGLEDKVVPPNQAEAMVNALKEKQIPCAYVPFEGEQHGFRKAENIKRALDLELYFYARIFGFTTPDQIEPVTIWNL